MSLTYIIAVAACAVLVIAAIVGLVAYALSGEKPHGSHARRPLDAPPAAAPAAPAAPAEPDPFADPDDGADPDEAADRYITELRGTAEPEPAPVLAAPVAEPDPEPEPVPALPVAATLEPLPPLDRRERNSVAILTLPAWEPPADRGTLSTIRDALQAWNPAPAGTPEPEPETAPEPAYDPSGENTQQVFLRVVGGRWNPAAMAAEIEQSVCGDAATDDRSDERAEFAR